MAITFLTSEDEKKYVQKVNGVTPDEYGNVDQEQISALIETDMLTAVHDTDGKILTDENGNVILRY